MDSRAPSDALPIVADFHCHTVYSHDGTMTVDALIEVAQAAGINCLAITDHNTIEGAVAMQATAPFKIIVSEEIKSSEGEIIGFFLKEQVPPGLSPEETVARIKSQGGLVCIPHPFDLVRRSHIKRKALDRILPQVDIIEAFNARMIVPFGNRRAAALVKRTGLPAIAGSDGHTPREIGQVKVHMPDFATPQEFLQALRHVWIESRSSSMAVHVATTMRRLLGKPPAHAV